MYLTGKGARVLIRAQKSEDPLAHLSKQRAYAAPLCKLDVRVSFSCGLQIKSQRLQKIATSFQKETEL